MASQCEVYERQWGWKVFSSEQECISWQQEGGYEYHILDIRPIPICSGDCPCGNLPSPQFMVSYWEKVINKNTDLS